MPRNNYPCVKCRHYWSPQLAGHGHFCNHPMNAIPHPVFGATHDDCAKSRSKEGFCGPDGHYFDVYRTRMQRMVDWIGNWLP